MSKIENKEKASDETASTRERIVVKAHPTPDGTSFYVAIPKEIRDILELKGEEYFLIKAKPEKREINLKLVKFVEEKQKQSTP